MLSKDKKLNDAVAIAIALRRGEPVRRDGIVVDWSANADGTRWASKLAAALTEAMHGDRNPPVATCQDGKVYIHQIVHSTTESAEFADHVRSAHVFAEGFLAGLKASPWRVESMTVSGPTAVGIELR
jgi:hypothetical protein